MRSRDDEAGREKQKTSEGTDGMLLVGPVILGLFTGEGYHVWGPI